MGEKKYAVKEMFFTLQGEGFHSGRPAVFCRFSGCNLWNGREEDRENAICTFCDTDFVGTDGQNGGKYVAAELTEKILELWPGKKSTDIFLVCTGGEPLLQLDDALIRHLHENEITIAIETNGTLKAPEGIDWICVSPKADTEIVLDYADELKLVYPQVVDEAQPENYADFPADNFFLQPLDSENLEVNTQRTLRYCLEHPQWSLSLQTHKILGID